ncbi:ATP-binding protein [Dyadobacter sp. CY343]|uniref:sensor histidine kinase n=1 Tax=Dyadobacter sp. CY343 TaxID=2907299 RepID=UPI001F2D366E|nr:GAF domain-containing sensor histidine kinase [Dyadobacter sp. CY343]MCE7063282.1 GAF domain-containing sensor histidine kinase [Dyadobacter sp. CY343]
MTDPQSDIPGDIAKIEQIPIVPTMLEVICRSTGMGFAAIARVTEDKWVACSVLDEISFGLKAGGELVLETTICNEIRLNHEIVVIDNVDEDPQFRAHHTPIMYGFKSYISVPIILKNGEFFGTLCAIDPKPASLKNIKTIGMFQLFVDLISYHLESIETAQKSRQKLSDMNHQLADSIHINSQFQFISNHNLQEPLRKMRVFSGMMLEAANKNDLDKVRSYATKVDASALKFSAIITELSEFTDLYNETNFETVDLNKVVSDATNSLSALLDATETKVKFENLPSIVANRFQMEQLFRNLITNSIQYAKKGADHVIRIYPGEIGYDLRAGEDIQRKRQSLVIRIEDNGEGFSQPHLEKIFDIFSQFPDYKNGQTEGHSLAYCRKIVNNHGGQIKAESVEGKGTTFSIILPVRELTPVDL